MEGREARPPFPPPVLLPALHPSGGVSPSLLPAAPSPSLGDSWGLFLGEGHIVEPGDAFGSSCRSGRTSVPAVPSPRSPSWPQGGVGRGRCRQMGGSRK